MTDSPSSLRPDIQGVLARLRGRIRRYVLIEGTCAALAVLAGLFWISLLADALHFQVRKLELPGWLRTGFLLLLAGAIVGTVAVWIVGRFSRRFRPRALALVLEKRFPQLGDRLITAVEMSGDPRTQPAELGGAMLERTIEAAAREASTLDLDRVFNPAPLRRWLTGAAVLLASVLVLGVTNASALERWYHAFVLLDDDYWEPYRRSALTVKVIAQPGDRVREFAADGTYKHPRGSDLTVLAVVPEEREIPEDITLRYRSHGGSGTTRGTRQMSPSLPREFRHTLGRVIDEHELWVMGGDYVNRRPFRVIVVDPPRLDQIALQCDYPAYTGMNSFADQEVIAQGTQVSLPMETRFLLVGRANKPLLNVHLRTEWFDLRFGERREEDGIVPRDVLLTIRPDATSPPRTVTLDSAYNHAWMSADRRSFLIPVALASDAAEQLQTLLGPQMEYLPLPPDSQLQIYLEDTDDIASIDPSVLTVNGIIDGEPLVETTLRGMGSSITRMARIPLAGRITDDYGVRRVQFGYRVDDTAEYSFNPIPQETPGQKEIRLAESANSPVVRFHVLPLELRVGQKLALTVFAEDGDNLNGPHAAHGEVYQFTVVSREDLMFLLYDKEMNLRLRFERIIEEVQQIREELVVNRQRYLDSQQLRLNPPAEGDPAYSDWQAQLDQLAIALEAAAETNLFLIRKNHQETAGVAVGFEDLRAEMVNNRVDTTSALQRIDDGILRPLSLLDTVDFPAADQHIGLFRLANQRGGDPVPHIDAATSALELLLARMQQILAEMQQRGTINEQIEALRRIIEAERQLLEETRARQRQQLFDFLN